jgi:hypothetical protein
LQLDRGRSGERTDDTALTNSRTLTHLIGQCSVRLPSAVSTSS